MIVAVSGANGFIGRHLCARLAAAGHDVRRIVRADYESGALPRLLRGAQMVVHAAGATRAPSEAALHRANVVLTRTTLRESEAAGVERFVFISSQAAAGPASTRDKPVDEDTRPAPIEAYGRSKLEAEALVRASGIPHTIVRPCAVYGPGDRDFLALFRLGRRGIAVHPGNRDQWISIAQVDDVVDGILLAARSDAARGRTYFLAGDGAHQWRQLFSLAAASAGRRIIVDIEVPRSLVDVTASFGSVIARLSGRASLLTAEKVALSRPKYWICSTERARRELAYTPRVSLQNGFAATYHWYLSQRWL